MRNKTSVLTLSTLCSALIGANVFAADSAGEPGRSAGKKNPLNNVYFGEQHLHTSASPDAFAFGAGTVFRRLGLSQEPGQGQGLREEGLCWRCAHGPGPAEEGVQGADL